MADISPASHPRSVQVWDGFVRIFHWSLVVCVMLNLFILEDGKSAHEWAGYTAVALVAARVVWGFVGSQHARFTDFFPTPERVRNHLRALRAGTIACHAGHNPLGALMVLTLMALVLLLGLTGWMQGLDAFWAQEWLMDLHEALADALMLLAGLHALAAIVMGRLGRTRLVRAMFTGIKDSY